MRYRLKFALVVLWSCHVLANADVRHQLPVRCSPHTNILVHQGDNQIKDARVDIYRVGEKGEIHLWSGLTDASGIASPPELPVGKYRVFADNGMSESEVYIDVETEYKWDRVGIYLPQSNQIVADALLSAPVTAKVREFRGIVQDETMAAAIPGVKIRIFRKEALNKSYMGQSQSDEKGKFVVHLDSGTYVAVFQRSGFKMRAIGFAVGAEGQTELRLRLSIGPAQECALPGVLFHIKNKQ